jgi:hypothetical protein
MKIMKIPQTYFITNGNANLIWVKKGKKFIIAASKWL